MTLDILVVDDEIAIGDLLVDLLGQEGYRVAWAPTAFDGLRLVAQLRPRVVLSDVMLPGLSGAELAARIAGHGPRCVLMSAAPRPPEVPDHVPFLRKPFDVGFILDVIAAELARATIAAGAEREVLGRAVPIGEPRSAADATAAAAL